MQKLSQKIILQFSNSHLENISFKNCTMTHKTQIQLYFVRSVSDIPTTTPMKTTQMTTTKTTNIPSTISTTQLNTTRPGTRPTTTKTIATKSTTMPTTTLIMKTTSTNTQQSTTTLTPKSSTPTKSRKYAQTTTQKTTSHMRSTNITKQIATVVNLYSNVIKATSSSIQTASTMNTSQNGKLIVLGGCSLNRLITFEHRCTTVAFIQSEDLCNSFRDNDCFILFRTSFCLNFVLSVMLFVHLEQNSHRHSDDFK